MFEWGGVSLGKDINSQSLNTGAAKEELFRISLATKQLLENNPLKSVRLFGKIFGKTKDYIIIESEYKEGESDQENGLEEQEKPQTNEEGEEEEESDIQKTKLQLETPPEINSGVNKHTYWVANAGLAYQYT